MTSIIQPCQYLYQLQETGKPDLPLPSRCKGTNIQSITYWSPVFCLPMIFYRRCHLSRLMHFPTWYISLLAQVPSFGLLCNTVHQVLTSTLKYFETIQFPSGLRHTPSVFLACGVTSPRHKSAADFYSHRPRTCIYATHLSQLYHW
jgi:hypothetical protein